MKQFFGSILILSACILIGACASIDYSPARFVPTGAPEVHLTTGVFGEGTGGVFISAVNTAKVDQPIPGREIIIPAGETTLNLGYFYAEWHNRSELKYTFAAERYYIIEGYPDFAARTVTYKTREATEPEFRSFQCATQRKIQKNLAGLNPQEAPACVGLP